MEGGDGNGVKLAVGTTVAAETDGVVPTGEAVGERLLNGAQASNPPRSTIATTRSAPCHLRAHWELRPPWFDRRDGRPRMLPMSANILSTAISYLFHLIATIIWIGWSGLIVLAPPVSPGRPPPLERLARRLTPLALVAFAALGVSGMYQLVTDPHYEDLLALTNTWSRLMFVKHVVYAAEALVLGVLRLSVEPEVRFLQRAAERGRATPSLPALQQRYRRLAQLNLALGLIVLGITAFVTAIP